MAVDRWFSVRLRLLVRWGAQQPRRQAALLTHEPRRYELAEDEAHPCIPSWWRISESLMGFPPLCVSACRRSGLGRRAVLGQGPVCLRQEVLMPGLT